MRILRYYGCLSIKMPMSVMPFSSGSRMADGKVVVAAKGKHEVAVKRDMYVAHAAAAFTLPVAVGSGNDAFNGVVRDVAIGHGGV